MDLYSGFVAIVGRPNVGKSTLLNCLIAEKVSITADKPQTTRHKILGIKTLDNKQAIYIDTPGMHNYNKKKINQYMNKTAVQALRDVDMVIFVIEALLWKDEDELVLAKLKNVKKPIILAINKIDVCQDKTSLLPFLENLAKKLNFVALLPISAQNGQHITKLQDLIFQLLPNNPFFFPAEQITDHPIRFRLAEIVREKLTRNLAKELPYALTVEIESLKQEQNRTIVHAIIWVERDSQKKIVIGQGGSKLKIIGTQARLDMNHMLNTKVHLQLWVKVRAGWTDNKQALLNFGYSSDT